ncbi:hypothetical protein WKH50_03510 [Pantoea agglomerans]|uniref:hypothetical protein n=1 Tax=Enterobacter agglomerans TaxID=549 RepID=UPI003C799DAB
MPQSHFSDWIVRFPSHMYALVSEEIENDCLKGTPHESLLGQVFRDVSFIVQDGCDKAAVLKYLVEKLNDISHTTGVEILHVPQACHSAFEVDYNGDGNCEIQFN